MRNGNGSIEAGWLAPNASGFGPARSWAALLALLVLFAGPVAASDEAASDPFAGWKQAATRDGDLAWAVYVEREPAPGVPAFRIETSFEVPPQVASRTLMASMSDDEPTTSGERRVLLERTETSALVHTFVDLPFMFSDRELAVRIVASHDAATGIHRIDWVDENEQLPPPDSGVLRLRTTGYWEFRPRAPFGTFATYVSRAEVGGSLPSGIQDRLMRGQAEDAVERLARLIGERGTATVASPPPDGVVPPSTAD